jgi:uncharacterized protein with PQ loop repeat
MSLNIDKNGAHKNMDTITWIGASACTAISLLPQVIKIIQENKAGRQAA